MAVSSPLELISPSGTERIYDATANISGGYYQAKVVASDAPSLWVVYSSPDWDHDHFEDRQSEVIVEPGAGTVSTPSSILSAQGFNILDPAVILFEHSQYRGYGFEFRSTIEDITSQFTQGSISGVSSAIITGGIWNLYAGFNFTGKLLSFNGKKDLGPGRYDFGCLPGNDQAKSIKRIGTSD